MNTSPIYELVRAMKNAGVYLQIEREVVIRALSLAEAIKLDEWLYERRIMNA